MAAGPSYFWLDPKVTKRSRQKKASPLSADSLRFSGTSRKAKPSFTPLRRTRFSVRPLPAFDWGL